MRAPASYPEARENWGLTMSWSSNHNAVFAFAVGLNVDWDYLRFRLQSMPVRDNPLLLPLAVVDTCFERHTTELQKHGHTLFEIEGMTRVFTWDDYPSRSGTSPEEDFDKFTKSLSEVRPRLAYLFMQLEAFIDTIHDTERIHKDRSGSSEDNEPAADVLSVAASLECNARALQRICRWHQEVAQSLGDVVSTMNTPD